MPIDGADDAVDLRLGIAAGESKAQIVGGDESMPAVEMICQPAEPDGQLTRHGKGERLDDANQNADEQVNREITRLGSRFRHEATPLTSDRRLRRRSDLYRSSRRGGLVNRENDL